MRVKFLVSGHWWSLKVDDPILSHTSWQQTCSLVTTSTKTTFLNFLPQRKLTIWTPSFPSPPLTPSPGALLWRAVAVSARTGRSWTSQWLPWDHRAPTVRCISSCFPHTEQTSSALCRTRPPLGPWSVKISFTMCYRTPQGNVLTCNALHICEVFLQESETG